MSDFNYSPILLHHLVPATHQLFVEILSNIPKVELQGPQNLAILGTLSCVSLAFLYVILVFITI
jgi:hypothetical protein